MHPVFEGSLGGGGPAINVSASLGAEQGLFPGVLGDADSRPALFADLAVDEAFVFAVAFHSELPVPNELVSLDGFTAPSLFELIVVVFAVLVE